VAKTAINPKREQNYPLWYQEVIKAADMAESSSVRGCMVIKPWGYAIWENIKKALDVGFKKTGHKNAYFPLFIPKSYLEKEAEHVEGFAKECAVVTHSRLEQVEGEDGLKPAGKLTQELVVRPTSETIIGESFSKWVKSYKDLPLLINQWANVVRWELRPRLFLRTAEFLWQEGHTVHATSKEAEAETLMILDLYAEFCRDFLAMPVIKGKKSESEKFPGAVDTYCIEAMMQDKKALQAGTSHFLGQNFAKSSQIRFQNQEGEMEFAWTTSWGVSTRLIGGLIMAHSDDNGLVLPPRIAPAQIVLLPIYKSDDEKKKVLEYMKKLKSDLEKTYYYHQPLEVILDDSNATSSARSWEWIKKGVPIRVEVGVRDLEQDALFVGRRDHEPREKKSVPREKFLHEINSILDNIQFAIYSKAKSFLKANTKIVDKKDEFFELFKSKGKQVFALSHWCGCAECEKAIKQELKATVRCIPFASQEEEGVCIYCGKKSKRRVVFAKSY